MLSQTISHPYRWGQSSKNEVLIGFGTILNPAPDFEVRYCFAL
jgi:hypothetical protein